MPISILDPVPEMIPLKEAARRTGLSYNALRKLCLRREICFIRVGSKFLVNFPRLCNYLNAGGTDK